MPFLSKLPIADALAAQAVMLKQLHEADVSVMESEHRAKLQATSTELPAVNAQHQAVNLQIRSILHDPRGMIQPLLCPSHPRLLSVSSLFVSDVTAKYVRELAESDTTRDLIGNLQISLACWLPQLRQL
jgi:hypothetical protein